MEFFVCCPNCGSTKFMTFSNRSQFKKMNFVECDVCETEIPSHFFEESSKNEWERKMKDFDYSFEEERQKQFEESLVDRYEY